MTTPDYDPDFYPWAQAQAAALRAKDWAALDLAHLPSLAPEMETLAAWAYPRARRDTAIDTGLPLTTFSEACPWLMAQVLAADFWPEAPRCAPPATPLTSPRPARRSTPWGG